jgi:TatD DNase family protein
MMIDSHAHIHDKRFDDDRDEVVARSKEAGMSHIISVGTNQLTSRLAIDCAEKYDMVYATVGMHPLHLFTAQDCEPEEQFVEKYDHETYRALAAHKKVVAIGEVGLDYHHFGPEHDVEQIKKLQCNMLQRFIDLCNEVEKPIVVHCWDGYDELLTILSENVVEKKGVIHSYVGSWKNAQKFVDLGYMIGLNGIVTYGESYDTLIRKIDLKNIMIETDCPYLPPRPLPRDGRCEPRDVHHVAAKIANVRNMSTEDVLRATTHNARELFGL